VDGIIDGSFDIFEDVVGASSQDDGREFTVIGISSEDN